MDAELIERLRQLEQRITMGANEACGDAATQGTADNARIAELEAKLATAERDALERAAVIAEGTNADLCKGAGAAYRTILAAIRAAKEQVNGQLG